jgi:hypothetical protein
MGTNRRFWPDSEVSLHGGASKQFGTCSRRSKYGGLMGNSQDGANVRKRASRREKTDRFAIAKSDREEHDRVKHEDSP